MTNRRAVIPHSSHWGAYSAIVERGAITAAEPWPGDPAPSPLLANIPDASRGGARIRQPMIRSGWLEHGPGPDHRRGADPFVPVSWDTLTDLLAGEYRRVASQFGPEAVFGGSYGWASAGRFHHAQSQIHRFLNTLGGYVGSVDTYSIGAGAVILRRVAAHVLEFTQRATSWEIIAESTDLVVAFGGLPVKNTSVSPGGASIHMMPSWLERAAARGTRFVHLSPLRSDMPAAIDPEWAPIEPGGDVAAMLAIAWTLIEEDRHDRAFLASHCSGWETLERYIRGESDGCPKTPEWAAPHCGLAPAFLRDLARRMAAGRTLVTVSWSLQRAEHGEQPVWMGLALAAMLGQIGLPGGGFGFGYGSMAQVGDEPVAVGLPTFPQGRNPVRAFIPVARIADLLLRPGDAFTYDGQEHLYPAIRLVAWAGGNPFHHHQDLGRLRRAFARPDTIVVHDPFWTATARHADIIVPSTISLERDDIGAASNDRLLAAMKQALPPLAGSRNDFDVLADLASALGREDAFTEGRDAAGWLRHIYETWRTGPAAAIEQQVPGFDEFWRKGSFELPARPRTVLFEQFRADPAAAPLATPSGRLDLASPEIDALALPDCPGHPAWLALSEHRTAAHPLALLANNPATRLHSQLDSGAGSRASKIHGREPIAVHPADAAARGITNGDVVRVFNERGACLAGVRIDDGIRQGVVQLATGAWYDPLDPADPGSPCVHGNPNVLTRDIGSSGLSQGCAGHLTWVEIERWHGALPPIRAWEPPAEAWSDPGSARIHTLEGSSRQQYLTTRSTTVEYD